MASASKSRARLANYEAKFCELQQKAVELHDARASRFFDDLGGDPSKLFEEKPSQIEQIASDMAFDEEGQNLEDEIEARLNAIRKEAYVLDRCQKEALEAVMDLEACVIHRLLDEHLPQVVSV